MAVTDIGGPVPVALSDDNRSYMDWPAIFAGAVIASAASFVLLTFGSAIGLSMTSAYEGSGVSLVAFAIAAALWLLWVHLISLFAGGYLAGRMRRRHGDATEHESDIRDGSHGLTVWAVSILVGAFIAVSGVSGAISTATSAVGSVGAAAAPAVAAAASSVDPTELLTDRLLRPDQAAGTSSAANATDTDRSDNVRAQLSRVLMSSLGDGALTAEDRDYVAAMIAAEAGIPVEAAQQRIDQFVAQAQEIEAEARAAADRARRIAMLVAFMTAASLFVGGAAAYYGATLGGNHRDRQTVFADWNRIG